MYLYKIQIIYNYIDIITNFHIDVFSTINELISDKKY